jgi:hypothetical protein
MSQKLRNIMLRFLPIIFVFVWSLIAAGQNCNDSASASVNYPTSWASEASIVEQVRSVSPVAAELVEGQQKQVLHHAFCLNCEGGVNAAYPPEDRELSRWQVKVSEEAVTFIIDHPVPADHLKPGFGVREVLVFHKNGQ